jgi:chromosome segregation ATPase
MKFKPRTNLEEVFSQLQQDQETIKQQKAEIESLKLRAEKAEDQLTELKDIVDQYMNGGRTIMWKRDDLGRFVREAWVRWAKTQSSPKPAWLVDYDGLDEADKEADRQIGEVVARWVLIGDAATFARFVKSKLTDPDNSQSKTS